MNNLYYIIDFSNVVIDIIKANSWFMAWNIAITNYGNYYNVIAIPIK